MGFDIATLAAQKNRETNHESTEWLKALESAQLSLKFTGISLKNLEQIALGSRSPAKFTAISRLIYQYGKSHAHGAKISERLIELSNESPFSLGDWIDAIDFFYQWLNQRKRKTDFLIMLEYLQCCVASPEAQEGGQSFTSLVEDMLTVCGYDG